MAAIIDSGNGAINWWVQRREDLHSRNNGIGQGGTIQRAKTELKLER